MKIEKITDNILKITITQNELQKRNIDIYNFRPDSLSAKRLANEIMETAGISSDSSHLSFEDFTYSQDGMITLMKIEYDNFFDTDDSFESFESLIKNKYQRSEIRLKRKNKAICSHVLIYMFDSMEDFIRGAKEISRYFSGESILYEYKKAYYLTLVSGSMDSGWNFYIDRLLPEYGSKVKNSSFTEGFLNEYGEKIFEPDAIETACKFL